MENMQQTQDPPVSEVLDMLWQGYSNEQIISALQTKGYSNEVISEAINQAHTKSSVEGTIPPTPSPPQGMQSSMLNTEEYKPIDLRPTPSPISSRSREASESMDDRSITEKMEEIVESVLDEKWEKVKEDIGDMRVWKEKVRMENTSIKQEILRLEARLEGLQNAIAGNMKEYDQGVKELGTSMKAMEKLMQNMITPLSTNISELKKIVDKLKK